MTSNDEDRMVRCTCCNTMYQESMSWQHLRLRGCQYAVDEALEMRDCTCGSTLSLVVTFERALDLLNHEIQDLRKQVPQPWEVIRCHDPIEALELSGYLRNGQTPLLIYPTLSYFWVSKMFNLASDYMRNLPLHVQCQDRGHYESFELDHVPNEVRTIIIEPDRIRQLRMTSGQILADAGVLVVACPIPQWIRHGKR